MINLRSLRVAAAALSTTALLMAGGASSPPPAGAAPTFTADQPRRVLDTRVATPGGPARRIAAGETLQVPIGAPAGVAGVQLNITAVNPDADGFVTAFPCGERPWVSTVSFTAHDTVANAYASALSPDGSVCFFSTAATDLVLDYSGAYPAGSGFMALQPLRLLDTRFPEAGPAAPVAADGELRLQLGGRSGLAMDARAVSFNLTITEPDAPGFATVYPCGARPWASNLNFGLGETVANAVVTALDEQGGICVYTSARAHVIVDVNGWFDASSWFLPGQGRLLDTRTECGSGAQLAAPMNPTVGIGTKEYWVRWRSTCEELIFTIGDRSVASQMMGLRKARVVFGAACPAHAAEAIPNGDGTFGGRLVTVDCAGHEQEIASLAVTAPTWSDGALVLRIPLGLIGQPASLYWYAALSLSVAGPEAEISAPWKLPNGAQPRGFAALQPNALPWATWQVPVASMWGTHAVVNLTATGATDGGYAVADGCVVSGSSTVNYRAGQTRANLVVVPLATLGDGRRGICVRGARTHLVVDVVGFLRAS